MPAAPCNTTCAKCYNLLQKKQGDDALQHTAEQHGSLQTNRWRGGGGGGERGGGGGGGGERGEGGGEELNENGEDRLVMNDLDQITRAPHAPAAPDEMGHHASYRPFVLQNGRRQTAVLLNLRALGPNMVADVLQSVVCDLN
jgi:hypothetical protein